MDGQTKMQNSTIKAYLQAFVHFEQNNLIRLFSMIKFLYNNAKNASTGHTLLELNYGYHPHVSYKKNLDSHSKLKTAEELSSEL